MMRITNRRRSEKGFTLIELLIVVAIIGIIAAILIPNLLDALQKAKQKRTVGDIRSVGTAWFSWLNDVIGASAAGQKTYMYPPAGTAVITYDSLQNDVLHTTGSDIFYIQKVPQKDGWGNDYEYYWNNANLLASGGVMAIAATARDGALGAATADAKSGSSVSPYTMGGFTATYYDEDIIWGDGFFVRYPRGAKVD